MKIFNPFKRFFKKTTTIDNSPNFSFKKCFYVDENVEKKIEEGFKGLVGRRTKKFPKELGEEHLFDFTITENLYRKFAFVTAVVDKYIDFVVGPGYYVVSKDKRAEQIIKDFLRDINFDTHLRPWLREALIKGIGFLELAYNEKGLITDMKVLNSNHMYVTRDEYGKIIGYKQYTKGLADYYKLKKLGKDDVIEFEPRQIALLSINKVGDEVGGMGIIYPCLQYIDDIIRLRKSMHTLMERKANVPTHVVVGDKERGIIPTDEDLEALGKKFEYMDVKHEWVTNPYVEFRKIDYGDIGGKFQYAIQHDEDMLFAGFQVPMVLMGKGRIPEGLAKVQMEAFMRRVQSIQSEVEKVVETQIFKPILNAHGIDAHVELEWGLPSDKEKNERLDRLQKFMSNPLLGEELRRRMEKDVAELLGYEDLAETPEEERERELETPQPIVPGQGREEEVYIHKESKNIYDELWRAKYIKDDVDYTIKEWTRNSKFEEFKDSILEFIDNYDFDELRAHSQEELELGKLSDVKIERLKWVLKEGFRSNRTIKQIANSIVRVVKPGPIKYKRKIKKKEALGIKEVNADDLVEFELVTKLDEFVRALMIARTEVTRATEGGNRLYMKKRGVKKVRWLASYGARTCELCSSLNNRIFLLEEAPSCPLHVNCRCLTEEFEE